MAVVSMKKAKNQEKLNRFPLSTCQVVLSQHRLSMLFGSFYSAEASSDGLLFVLLAACWASRCCHLIIVHHSKPPATTYNSIYTYICICMPVCVCTYIHIFVHIINYWRDSFILLCLTLLPASFALLLLVSWLLFMYMYEYVCGLCLLPNQFMKRKKAIFSSPFTLTHLVYWW